MLIGLFPIFSYDEKCCYEHSCTMNPGILILEPLCLSFTSDASLCRMETFHKISCLWPFGKLYALKLAKAVFDLHHMVCNHSVNMALVGFVVLQNNMQLTFIFIICSMNEQIPIMSLLCAWLAVQWGARH